MVIDGRIHRRDHSVTIQKDGTFHGWLPDAPHAGDTVIIPIVREPGEKGPGRIGQFRIVSVAPYKGSYIGRVDLVGVVSP